MPYRYAVGMIDWLGKPWDFTNQWAAGIKAGGIQGLGGSMSDVAVTPLDFGGQSVVEQRPEPISGTLTFHCRAVEGRSAGEVQAELRRAFSPLLTRKNTLQIASPMGRVDLEVRRGGRVEDPFEDPSASDVVLNVEIPVVSDEGIYWQPPIVQQGTARVVNAGEVPTSVVIGWQGSGGRVELPSGAVFTLPYTAQPRLFHLTRRRSMRVEDASGVRDERLWRQLRSVSPEVIPVGAERVFKVPSGAWVQYRLGVLDPWQQP